eukprot:302938_1
MDDNKKLTELCIEIIKKNLASISFNKSKNCYELTLKNCKLIENIFDKKCVKLSIEDKPQNQISSGLGALKEDGDDEGDDEVDDNKKEQEDENKNKTNFKNKKK